MKLKELVVVKKSYNDHENHENKDEVKQCDFHPHASSTTPASTSLILRVYSPSSHRYYLAKCLKKTMLLQGGALSLSQFQKEIRLMRFIQEKARSRNYNANGTATFIHAIETKEWLISIQKFCKYGSDFFFFFLIDTE